MQRPKEHVKTEILAAASTLFAEVGYEGTSIAAVAKRAGIATGNVYRYFESKEELFAAVVPEAFATELERRTQRRIEALGDVRDARSLSSGASYHVLSGELLDFCIAQRERVVIVLGQARGTPFATFEETFRQKLVTWAIGYVRMAWPSVCVSATLRFALDRIYRAFLASLAAAFATYRSPEQIREATAHLTAHHLGGLKHLFETAALAATPSPPSARSEGDPDDELARVHPPAFVDPAARPAPGGAGSPRTDRGASSPRARPPDRSGRTRRRR